MQIVKQTSTILKLQVKNKLFSRLCFTLFGTLFFISGLAIIMFFGELARLNCERLEPTQVSCQLISSRLLRKQVISIPTGQLQSAQIEVSEDDDGDTYRIVLITKNDRIPLTGAEMHVLRYFEFTLKMNREAIAL